MSTLDKNDIDIYSFGQENGGPGKWYAGKDGVRIKCGEEEIDHLWWKWIMHKTAERADADGYVIFTVSDNPLRLTLNNQ